MTDRNERRRGPGPVQHATTWRERTFVLGGLGLAALATAVLPALGAGMDVIGPLWMAAVVWTAVAQAVHALWLGLCRGDWSAFGAYGAPVDGDAFDWSTRTGAYAYLRVREEHERLLGDSGDSVAHGC